MSEADWTREKENGSLSLLEPPGLSRRNRPLLSVGMGIVIFLCGIVIGAAAMNIRHERQRRLPLRDRIPALIADQLQRDLTLSRAQHDQIAGIVKNHQEEMRKLRAELFPHYRPLLEEFVIDVSKVLTPQQQSAWKVKLRDTIQRMGIQDNIESITKQLSDVKGGT